MDWSCDKCVADLHNRMPVILKNDVLADWINPETSKADALEMLQENRGADQVFYPVTKAVGSVKNKEPELIEQI